MKRTTRYRVAVFLVATLAGLALAWNSCAREDLDDAARLERMHELYAEYAAEFPTVREVSPEQAMAWQEAGQVVFIDVRDEQEQAVSMIPGALAEEDFLALLQDQGRAGLAGKHLVAYCTIGYRSGRFAEQADREMGLEVLNLEGALLGWVHAGGQVVDGTGEAVNRIHVYGRTWNLAPTTMEAVW